MQFPQERAAELARRTDHHPNVPVDFWTRFCASEAPSDACLEWALDWANISAAESNKEIRS